MSIHTDEDKNRPDDEKVMDDVHDASAVEAEAEYGDEEYRKLLKKLDWYLMPIMAITYGVQYCDKQSISTSTLFGLVEDNGLHGQQTAWLSTIFYLAYLAFEFPMNYIMQKVNLGRFLAAIVFVWGAMVMLLAACHNFAGLMVLRTFIGALESCISPGFLLIVASWYKRQEHGTRSMIWMAQNGFFSIFIGLITYGIGSATDKHNTIAPWRAINLFLGGMTVAWSIVLFLFLGTPSEVRWLNVEEKKMAAARIVSNQSRGSDKSEWEWDQVKEAFLDPQVWFYFFISFLANIPNGGYGVFGSLVTKSFGFTSLQVILLNMPGGAIGGSFNIISGYLSSKWRNTRTYFMAFSMIAGCAGLLVAALLPSEQEYRWKRWGGLLTMSIYSTATFMGWSMLPSNVAGNTKRSTASAMSFVAYAVANACGSQLYKDKDAPLYRPGLIGSAICFGLTFVAIFMLRFYYMWVNAKRDKLAKESGLSEEEMERQGKINGENGMTDLQNPHFRYTY
ncbi:hypothetical protein I350_03288 [Cryptococcus amylolentus CBS 6273]|uniref:Major facilitator superfamily (MFS) profile domain-containing protein n=1 Tax=Cryptococcus amylolentus CBS 6273 TaxID=1296118 RepID=A0A1E3K3J5_9TREE|nr:hypothetical protein I350_03288 [Cryptococcus amylolentus CBS 6273]